MYFVHPQIKFNIQNLIKLSLCFIKKPDKKALENLKRIFPKKEIYLTDMGRSAFKLIVENLNLQNSEMLMPAFICDIFYKILKDYNITPLFLDIEKDTFNISPQLIEEKISPKTKSILVCHTYGLPADLEKILALAKKHNLLVIEDCAHTLGAKYNEKLTGMFGDASFFSVYKVFPSLRGGIAIINNQKSTLRQSSGLMLSKVEASKINPSTKLRVDAEQGRSIKNQKYLLKTHFNFRDFISLLNCFSFFSFLFKKFAGEIAPKYTRKEKLEKPSQLNRVSLNIFSWQLENLESILQKRKELGLFFQAQLKKIGFEVQAKENNIFTFLSALCPKNIDRDKLVIALRKKMVFALRIWREPIILNQKVQQQYNINPDEFPSTKEAAKRIINLPLQNFYTKKDIKKMIKIIQETVKAIGEKG